MIVVIYSLFIRGPLGRILFIVIGVILSKKRLYRKTDVETWSREGKRA